MRHGLQDLLQWLNGEDESATPEEASMANIFKLAALSAMATLLEHRYRENHDSDEDDSHRPGAGK